MSITLCLTTFVDVVADPSAPRDKLWLQSDPALAEQIVRRQLSALESLTARQRSRYTETLGAWLDGLELALRFTRLGQRAHGRAAAGTTRNFIQK